MHLLSAPITPEARAMAKRTPVLTRSFVVLLQSLGRSGDGVVCCARCGTRMLMTFPAVAPMESAITVAAICEVCGTGFSVTLAPMAATRPPASVTTTTTASRRVTPPPVADAPAAADEDELLRTLAGWQAQGLGIDLHPSEAAAIPRRADEAPHRRNEQGLRLYTRAEIEQAIALHHGGQADE